MTDNIERSTIRMEIPYFQTPNAIFDTEIAIDIYAKMTYIYLTRCSNQGATAFPSYQTIGKRCGMSKRKAMYSVQQLIKCNLLEKEVRKKSNSDNYSNIYRVNDTGAYSAPPSASNAPPGEHDAPNKETTNKESPYKEPLLIDGSIKDTRKRSGGESIPFMSFVTQEIQSFDTVYDQDIPETIEYYYAKYQRKFKKEHTRYKRTTLLKIFEKLDNVLMNGITDPECGNRELTVDLAAMKLIIDKHFATNYGTEMSWTLLSFINNDIILKNRYYECGLL